MPWQEIVRDGERKLTWVKPAEAVQAVTKAWGEQIQAEKPAFSTADPRPEYTSIARVAIMPEVEILRLTDIDVVDAEDS